MRYALRMMWKSPAFTAVAVVTLALGIGANTAIFSVVNALLLHPLPIADPARIVTVTASSAARGVRDYNLSLTSYETLRDQSHLLSGVAAFCGDSLTFTGGEFPEHLATARVSPNFFDLMGTRPMLGRGFDATEGTAGGAPVALIGYSFWQRRFAGDRGIVGRTIPLDRESYTVIGVLPPEYPFPFPGIDVWITRLSKYGGLQPEQIVQGAGFLRPLGRLAPGATMAAAAEEVQAIHVRYKQENPRAPDGNTDSRLSLTPLQESITQSIRPTLTILTGAVGLVLLIACANVAALFLARATARANEIVLRAALGASRRQLVSQLLWESLLLSAAGALLGVALASWGVEQLVKADAGNNLPGFQPIGVDLTVLAFTAVTALITGAVFGLIPALQVSRPDLNGILRDAGRGSVGGGPRRRLRSVLVTAQIGLSIVLLIGAGLLIESFRQVRNLKLGFDPTHTLTARLTLPPGRYPDGPRRKDFVHEVARRLEGEPGVSAVAISQSVPMTSSVLSPVLAEGQPFVPVGQRPLAQWNGAAPGYFRTVGIPLATGRDFTWADDEKAPRVVIVNQALAHRFWPGENPLGKHVTFTRFQAPFEVVGVVGDTRSGSLEAAPRMAIYSSYGQWTWQRLSLTLRTPGNPMALSRTLAAQVAAVDRDLAVTDVQPMEDVVADAMLQRRETMYLIAGFAALALVLAVIGLYGVMAYSVAQRTAEIGIRQAIGARRADILRMVIGQGLRLSLAGVVLGALAAVLLTRLMERMLFQVSATDPGTFVAIAGIFLVVGLAASFVPAWRATRIGPLDALRER
jgi:putative ABC transport system permease protein